MGFKKLNKKGVQFSSISLAVIAFSLFIISVGIIVGGWNDNYNSGVTSDLEGFNRLNDISNIASDNKDSLSNVNPSSDENGEAATYRGAFGVITNIFQPFSIVFGSDGMLSGAADRFGIPAYVLQGIVAIAVVVMVFSLIAVIFRSTRSRV